MSDKPKSLLSPLFASSQAESREEIEDRMVMDGINSESPQIAAKDIPTNKWDEISKAVARQAIDEQMGLRP